MPADLQHTLIVMPAYNEEASVGQVVRELHEKIPGVACLVVNDGSADATSFVARSAGATVAELPYNLGVGGAMRLGFKYALANGYTSVVQVDADGQHDPGDIPALLDALEDADVVIGARFAGGGHYDARGPRRWAMSALAAMLSRTAGTKLTDTTSGFRASGERAVRLFAEHYPAEYLGDTIESLVIAARSGCTIRQVPASMRPRTGGTPSHNPFKAAVFLARVGMAVAFAFLRPRVDIPERTAR